MPDSTNTTATTHERLALHLAAMGMGLPATPNLVEILERLVSAGEAEVMLALPAAVAPLTLTTVDELAERHRTAAPETLTRVLDSLLDRNLLYGGRTPSGERGYGLLQAGFGFPQTFFWSGEESDEAREMAGLVAKYANRHVLREMYAATSTKAYRYIPLDRALSSEQQAVFPYHAMGPVLDAAVSFAVAHCPCRVAVGMRGKRCGHSLEVCLKFDEMAEYVIERGLARRISRDEAADIVRRAADEGLVHFVDNAAGHAKHNCNCCGDACWNVGTIRRRKIPRDVLMATYFLRTTATDDCTGCGICAEVCPVQAVTMEEGKPTVDSAWCIGCGVCVTRCADAAAGLTSRADSAQRPAADPETLTRHAPPELCRTAGRL